ncbi:MAG: hypothetical protein AVDCRST_MAG77-5156 [uncultured Chloroflexi bacterium]|uniref:Pirin n=1 Tax=uncultured Chloroflexota bacterium TaxID=166587 RepID=A0A6J4K473_9CHLR|nr:MAG: hypothetical protein AVDCRST_MAG77-5156 [uncultured Chloroflexota bacterium]
MTTVAETNPHAATGQQQRDAVLVANAHTVMEGAGVPVTRVLPSREATYRMVDPWLLLDEFKMDSFGGAEAFPPHPHRGFEIVTYMIEGTGHHTDSEGNEGVVGSGGLQRITAGRGIWHGEGGGDTPERVHGLQLWINLPKALKKIDPAYQPVSAEQIPERTIGGARVRVLVGEGSPTQLQTPAVYYDVRLPAGGNTTLPVPAGFQGFAFVLGGAGHFGANKLAAREKQNVVLGPGGDFPVSAGPDGAWFVLAAAQPIREPVYFNGPYVD